MIPLALTVFIASLFGSMHCVGMCGPLAILASSRVDGRRPRPQSIVAYHGGRIVAYAGLGLIVGWIGSGVHETGTWLGLQRLATQLAGGSMLVIGLLGIAGLAGGTLHSPWIPAWFQKRLAQGHNWARKRPPLRRAFAIGVLTAILPCGWLYAFLLVAAGTADPVIGAMVMGMFALGSIPALTGVAVSTQWIVGRFRTAIPWCTAILISIVGLYTLAGRANADLSQVKKHDTAQNWVDQIKAIDHEEMPCCDPKVEER